MFQHLVGRYVSLWSSIPLCTNPTYHHAPSALPPLILNHTATTLPIMIIPWAPDPHQEVVIKPQPFFVWQHLWAHVWAKLFVFYYFYLSVLIHTPSECMFWFLFRLFNFILLVYLIQFQSKNIKNTKRIRNVVLCIYFKYVKKYKKKKFYASFIYFLILGKRIQFDSVPLCNSCPFTHLFIFIILDFKTKKTKTLKKSKNNLVV
jgi:hypothetical protein